MWTYRVTSGEMIRPEGTTLCNGYSGKGPFKNDPNSEALHNRGPIPQGRYFIGDPIDTVTHGPYVLPLTPSPDNIMYGRDGFLIHGDSITDPGNASEGCIVLAHQYRIAISISGDYDLLVTE